MKNSEKEMWRINIENSATTVCSLYGKEVVSSVFQRYGFQSGRDTDKFADLPYDVRMSNGIRYVPEYTNTVFSCEVIDTVDLETQTLYVARVVETKILSNVPGCTYGYYQEHIKPKKAPAADQPEGWRCKVCGFFYEGHELPEGYACELCKHGAEEFEYVPASATPKKKGFVCKVCGHFEECDADALPEGYTCPICNHGAEDFEPAVQ